MAVKSIKMINILSDLSFNSSNGCRNCNMNNVLSIYRFYGDMIHIVLENKLYFVCNISLYMNFIHSRKSGLIFFLKLVYSNNDGFRRNVELDSR